jgi:prepilin-type N-terminal cleavage/methylation domain-containing protein
MNRYNDGYTLIETLVALTLVLLLLFLVSEILPLISMDTEQRSLLTAIHAARNQLEETLTFKKYETFTRELSPQLSLIQSIEQKNNILLITITVEVKATRRILFRLQAYDFIKTKN